jgi:hypothetical protein
MSIELIEDLEDTLIIEDVSGSTYLIIAAETGNFLLVEQINPNQIQILESELRSIDVEKFLQGYIDVQNSCGALPYVDYLDISQRDSNNDLLVYGGRTTDISLNPVLPIWQIFVLNISTLEKKYAGGDQTYTHIWSNRESLIYS